jgi:hypothetical protein
MPNQHVNKEALNLYNNYYGGDGGGGGGGSSRSSLPTITRCCAHSNKPADSGSKKGRIFRHCLTDDPTS